MRILLISSNNKVIQKYLEKGKTIGFIPTASEVESDRSYMLADYNKLKEMGYKIIDIDITNMEKDMLDNLIFNSDCLYIAGGNTFYLLQQIKQKNIYDSVIKFINSNKLYVGASAGAVLLVESLDMYKSIDDPKEAPLLKSYDSLNVINFYPIPHYDMEYFKNEFDRIIPKYQSNYKLVSFKNNETIIVTSNSDYKIVETD
jgi:dipeptidase E